MRAELVAVGTELLLGDIVNTNAAYLGQRLAAAGIDCHWHTVVGDNEERIAETLALALRRSDAVIVTGGLGPTQDDVTREAVAKMTGRMLHRSPRIEEWLRSRFAELGRPMPEVNLRQAAVPEGASVIDQRWGTAPGLIVVHDAKPIYLLPGVPAEMREMFDRAVLPDLLVRAGSPARILSRVLRIAGMTESALAEALAPLWERLGGPVKLAFLASGGEARIRVTAKAATEEEARALLDQVETDARAILGTAVVGVDGETVEAVIGAMLAERGLSLACAESMTGGLVGGRLTSVPGASAWFRGSIVSYATEVKARLLGVPTELLESSSPVDVEVARAMATGARELLGADVAVAVTGVAGPSEQGRPVGTVALAVVGPALESGRELRLPGDRETVRLLAVSAALNLVRIHLVESER